MVSAVHVHTTPAPDDAAQVEGGAIRFVARVSEAGKCARCWHHRDDVGAHLVHPALCGRCVENVDGPGESRRWF
jgi:isoleucyl-tRNA synthetase